MSAANAQVMRRLDVALGAVVEQRPRRRRSRCGVGEVVGEDLVGIGPAALVEAAHGGADDAVGERDDVGRGRQVGQWWRASRRRRYRAVARRAAGSTPGAYPLRAVARLVGVFCGSNAGALAGVRRARPATRRRRSPAAGIGLVYGGGHVGLMGAVADAVLDGGGEVIGVITEHLVRAEIAHAG